MINNYIVSTMKDMEKKFSSLYKTEVLDNPNNAIADFPKRYFVNVNFHKPRYSLSIFAGDAEIEISYYSFRNNPLNYEVLITVYDQTASPTICHFVRYFNIRAVELEYRMNDIFNVLAEAVHAGYQTEDIVCGIKKKLPWR